MVEEMLFKSYFLLFYILNTYKIFAHAYKSIFINDEFVKDIVYKNYEFFYYSGLSYIIFKTSKFIYNITYNFNYESKRFDFYKLYKINNKKNKDY